MRLAFCAGKLLDCTDDDSRSERERERGEKGGEGKRLGVGSARAIQFRHPRSEFSFESLLGLLMKRKASRLESRQCENVSPARLLLLLPLLLYLPRNIDISVAKIAENYESMSSFFSRLSRETIAIRSCGCKLLRGSRKLGEKREKTVHPMKC